MSDLIASQTKNRHTARKRERNMILKRWIHKENRWEFWDGIERISHQRENRESDKDIKKEILRILLSFRNEKKEPFEMVIENDLESTAEQVYILNDDGKTIERIN